MTDVSLDELTEVAEQAARSAGRLAADRLNQKRTIEYKGGIDLVTDADKACEAEIVAHLRARFPTHALLAEESGFAQGSAEGYRWIVDPIDGTTNYAHHVPHFCVSVAVEGPLPEGGLGLLAGVVYAPMTDELFSATRGKGARCNGSGVQVSSPRELARSLLSTGFPYDVREKPEAPVGLFNRVLRKAQGVRRMGAAALDLAYVACGRFDGFFEFGLKPWDIAAGALLVQEAGGVMRRIDGAPLDLRFGDVLACGPGIAEPLQAECAEFLKEVGYTPRQHPSAR
jgi:myo-inositol-1(or 4)-monophosphatase